MMAVGSLSRRGIAIAGFAAMAAYIAWIGGPYLRSTFVRDAAVTTWVSVTASLVGGYLDQPIYAGDRIGPNGRIAGVVDPQTDTTALVRAEGDLLRAQARLEQHTQVVETMRTSFQAREERASQYVQLFKQDLDAAIAGTRTNMEFIGQQLERARSELSRKQALLQSGHAAQADIDVVVQRAADYQRALTELGTSHQRFLQRRRAADARQLLLEDGTDASQVLNDLDGVRAQLQQVEAELKRLQTEVTAAELGLAAASASFERARSSVILGPPGAQVWSLISAPGAPVTPGSAVASWVDCRVMLVDVPLSDVEIALLKPGARADVVLEGEREQRPGVVLLLRGSAATIGNHDLAALAKGRRPGIGQALIKLEPTAADIASCPIGHAAFVDFPDVGFFDILRARLRL